MTAGTKKGITIYNEARGSRVFRLLNQQNGRLSGQQVNKITSILAPPGYAPQGLLGEWPLIQEPPEWPGERYVVVQVGPTEGSTPRNLPAQSDMYFVPVDAVPALLAQHGITLDEWLQQAWLTRQNADTRAEVRGAFRALAQKAA
jgi:hypothetical protein